MFVRTNNMESMESNYADDENYYSTLGQPQLQSTSANSQTSRKRQRTLSDVGVKSSPRAQKPPPINIVGKTLSDVQSIMKKINLKHEIKLTKEGIRVFMTTVEDFKQTIAEIKQKNFNYYTHQLREEQLSKFVINGLPKIDTETITKCLADEGTNPISVKMMRLQNQSDSHAIYIAYFKRNSKMKLTWLNENIKVIENIRIKWVHYRNETKGPTQCRNCQNYGHGSQNCNISPRCVRCAGEHKSAECPLLIDEVNNVTKKKVNQSQLVCALCKENHTASSKECKERPFTRSGNKYQIYVPKKQQQQQASSNLSQVPVLSEQNFPSLTNSQPEVRANVNTNWRQDRPSQNNANLYSQGELTKIFMEITSSLAGAKNKSEQVQIIMGIAIKYLTYDV